MAEINNDMLLPEHAANPFIAPLGPVRDFWGNLALFDRRPAFSEAERALPPQLRRYCALRLFRYTEPFERQAHLAERMGMIIREGYIGRDPTKGFHHAAILGSVDRIEAGDFDLPSTRDIASTAVGFALLGHPGMGKSRSVQLVLESFPRTLRPRLSYSVVQVPWLKIECPSRPTRKMISIAILNALDERLGTSYLTLTKANRTSADILMLQVQNKLCVHAVGILVIDEIQNMSESPEGSKAAMNFLVMLVNAAGIPVMLVGTMGATRVIQEDFRGARRAAGLGSPIWERLRPGEEWDEFLGRLMTYQWTKDTTPLTPELSHSIYRECQGILSVAITLMVLVQFRIMQRAEVFMEPELIDPTLVRDVANEEFKVIRPMIAALREGDDDALSRYPDLEEFGKHIDNVFASAPGVLPSEIRQRLDAAASPAANPENPSTLLRAALAKRGIGADVIERVVAQVGKTVPSGDIFEMIAAARALIEGIVSKPRKRRIADQAVGVPDPLDLREIVKTAKSVAAANSNEVTTYDALRAANVVATVDEILGS